MKTFKQFDKQEELGYTEFLNPMDRIDEELFHYIICGHVASNYENGYDHDSGRVYYAQAGECNREDEYGTMFYETVMSVGDKFWYLGEMPSINKSVYRCEEYHSYI